MLVFFAKRRCWGRLSPSASFNAQRCRWRVKQSVCRSTKSCESHRKLEKCSRASQVDNMVSVNPSQSFFGKSQLLGGVSPTRQAELTDPIFKRRRLDPQQNRRAARST